MMSPDQREQPRASLVVEKSALRLAALNRPAETLGLLPGLSLADARARYPDLQVADHDGAADARVLEGFADACERYTPLLACEAPDGLMLDVSGCTHLFGGEQGLVRDLLRRVTRHGFAARAAVAATPGAAFALARFSGRRALVVERELDLEDVLAPLPLAALRPEPHARAALAKLGFVRIGDLQGKPRAPLAARFGAALLARWDEAAGRTRIALTHRFPPPRFSAEKPLFEPVERVEDVLGLTEHLAGSLAQALERHGLGARRLDLTLFRVDGKVSRLSVGTGRPVRTPAAIRRLFAEKVAAIESLDSGFGFDLLRLSAPVTEALAPQQQGFDTEQAQDAALDTLVDRLAARLGRDRVQVLVAADSHSPEQACRAVPAQQMRRLFEGASLAAALAVPPVPEVDADGPIRPLRLFACPERVEAVAEVPDGPPIRFRWRRVLHQVIRCEGPERIAAPWWQAEPAHLSLTRDYFRVETRNGRRFWLFRAGLYGREAAHPDWYVHGMFG